jgi:hypothetical protein
MGNIYLNNNESILLSTHNVVINTIPAEAILTNQRLILVDASHSQLRPQDIPFTALETITIGDNSAMDPVLSLSVVLPDETRHMLGIAFPQVPKTKRTGERDTWATRLKEASVAAQQEHGIQPAILLPPWIAGELPDEPGREGKEPKPAEDKYYNPPLAPRKPRARSPKNTRMAITLGVVIILIIFAAAAVFVFTPSIIASLTKTPAAIVTPQQTPSPSSTPTELPEVTEEPTPEVIPESLVTPEIIMTDTPVPQIIVPQTGIWMRIEYSGNFTASFGTSGRLRELSGSGNQIYQIPAKDEIVLASITKSDESGNRLTVSIYNDGELAKSSTTTSPHGTVEIQADLRVKTSAAVPDATAALAS